MVINLILLYVWDQSLIASYRLLHIIEDIVLKKINNDKTELPPEPKVLTTEKRPLPSPPHPALLPSTINYDAYGPYRGDWYMILLLGNLPLGAFSVAF